MTPAEMAAVVAELRHVGTDRSRVEAKSAAEHLPTKSLWPTVSAFSNTSGGIILLGLDENDDFTVNPRFDAHRTADALEQALGPAGGALTPEPKVEIDIVPFEDGALVVVEVAELDAAAKPCFVTTKGKENGSYRRLSDGDHRMSTFQVIQLSAALSPQRFDIEPVDGATVDDLDPDQIRTFVARLRRTRPRLAQQAPDDASILVRAKAIDGMTGLPTLAGLLCFGYYPQQWFPQLMVSVVSYPGRDKSDPTTAVRTLDRFSAEGSIPQVAEDAVNRVLQALTVRREVVGVGGTDIPEIPPEALREAIVNAVAHRDYSPFTLGAQVRVEIFADRVDIVSPGGLWGGQNVEDLWNGDSNSRNAALTKLLTDVPLPGTSQAVAENAGSGIAVMTASMRQQGLPIPRFRDNLDSFAVTLDRHGLLDPQMQKWFRSIGAERLDRQPLAALALLHDGQSLTKGALRQQLGIDSDDAEHILTSLVEEGWLRYPVASSASFLAGPRLTEAQRTLDLGGALSAKRLTTSDRLLTEFDGHEQLTARELSERTGRGMAAIRRDLKKLVDASLLVPTANPSSRSRAYRRSR